jgi:catechol 2,3-dioxygenase-like lactoylglutathione lyase family enzyme
MEIQSPLGTLDAAVTSLYVAALDAAIHWYEAMLGLQPASVGDDVHPDAAYQPGRVTGRPGTDRSGPRTDRAGFGEHDDQPAREP